MDKFFLSLFPLLVSLSTIHSNVLNSDCPFKCVIDKLDSSVACIGGNFQELQLEGDNLKSILNCKLNVVSVIQNKALYELSLGNGESVSRIDLTGLGEMAKYVERLALKFNILRMQSSLFEGFDYLSELTVYAIAFIESDIFYNLPHLTSISFYNYQTEVLPRYLLFNTNQTQRQITLDLMTQCYRCRADTSRLVIVPHAVQNSFVMQTTFSEACEVVDDPSILGCEGLPSLNSSQTVQNTQEKNERKVNPRFKNDQKLLQLPENHLGISNKKESHLDDSQGDLKPRLVERHLGSLQQSRNGKKDSPSLSSTSFTGNDEISVNYFVVGGVLLWCISLTIVVIVLLVLVVTSRRAIRRIGYIMETNPPCSKSSFYSNDRMM